MQHGWLSTADPCAQRREQLHQRWRQRWSISNESAHHYDDGQLSHLYALAGPAPSAQLPQILGNLPCALWPLIQAHADVPPSWALFGQLFLDALTQTPTAFDPAWLSYSAPPVLIREHHRPEGNGFAELRHMILYQIADLQRLSLAGVFTDEQKLLDLWLGAGVSPTGHRWSNLYPSTFLGQIPYGLQENSPWTDCSWADLAIVLWIGQIYE